MLSSSLSFINVSENRTTPKKVKARNVTLNYNVEITVELSLKLNISLTIVSNTLNADYDEL